MPFFSFYTDILGVTNGLQQSGFDDTGLFWIDGVPEPSTALLFASGLVGLAVRRRRRAR